MEVIDPNTGLGVTVRMRRDLPGYHVTRARNSPRLRWSLPVDIQWQSECIIKFLGQNCACCDVISGPKELAKSSDDSVTQRSVPAVGASGKAALMHAGSGSGHGKVYVDSQNVAASVTTSSKGLTRGRGSKGTATNSAAPPAEKTSSSVTQSSEMIVESVSTQGDVTTTAANVDQHLSPLSLDMFTEFPLSPSGSGKRRARRRRQLMSTSDMLVPTVTERPPADSVRTDTKTLTDRQNRDVAAKGTSLTDIAEEESKSENAGDVTEES